MAVNFRILIFTLTVLLSVSQSTAWWWGSGEPSHPPPPAPNSYEGRIYAMYHPRFMPQPTPAPAPVTPPAETVPVPAIPIQVPLKAQLAPHPNMQNVQLVRCLCPVVPDETHMMNSKDVYAQPINNVPNV